TKTCRRGARNPDSREVVPSCEFRIQENTAMNIAEKLKKLALRLPGTEQSIACKGTSAESATVTIGGKAFLFVNSKRLIVKLGESLPEAIELARQEPNHFKAGAGGWVTVLLGGNANLKLKQMEKWLAESYQISAPKKPVTGNQRSTERSVSRKALKKEART